MSVEISSYCHVAQATDVGCQRAANEDACGTFECRNGLVAVVCDGMGGHVGGAVASQTAVAAIRDFLTARYFDSPAEAIVAAVNAANAAIIDRTRQQPELRGMGSTCVILIVRDGAVWYGIVGDSRIYLVSRGTITQLTKDQSYVQMLVDAGQITKEEAEHHPRKNEITNALGLDTMRPAVVSPEPVHPQAGDCFVLCSDGLSGMVPDAGILGIVSRQAELSQQKRVEALIEAARAAGGLDNITCQIVEFSVTPSEAIATNVTPGGTSGGGSATQGPAETPRRKRNKPLLIFCLAAAVVFLVAIGIAVNHFFFSTPTAEEVVETRSGNDEMAEICKTDKNAVPLLIAEGDSAVTFAAGADFASILVSEATSSAVLQWRSKSGKKEIKLPDAVDLTTVIALPRDIADTAHVSNAKTDLAQLMFRFAGATPKAKEGRIKIFEKKGTGGKTFVTIKIPTKAKNYYCIFEVNMPKPKPKAVKPAAPKAAEENAEEPTADTKPAVSLDKTVKAKRGDVIKIHNGAGANSNSQLCIGNDEESKGLATKAANEEGGWYTLDCPADGTDCVITITRDVPAKSHIMIPVSGGQFKLRVEPA